MLQGGTVEQNYGDIYTRQILWWHIYQTNIMVTYLPEIYYGDISIRQILWWHIYQRNIMVTYLWDKCYGEISTRQILSWRIYQKNTNKIITLNPLKERINSEIIFHYFKGTSYCFCPALTKIALDLHVNFCILCVCVFSVCFSKVSNCMICWLLTVVLAPYLFN